MNKITTSLAALLLAAVPATGYAQFGGLAKKAQQAKEKVTNKGTDVTTKASNTKAKTEAQAAAANRPPLPWSMEQNGKYNGKDVDQFLLNIVDVPDEELKALREQMDARFKSNSQILKGKASYDIKDEAKAENERWWNFYGRIQQLTDIWLHYVTIDSNGLIDKSKAEYLIADRKNGIVDCAVVPKGDTFVFSNSLQSQYSYVTGDNLKAAQEAALRMRKFQIFTRGLHPMWDELGEKYDYKDRYMFNFEGIYAMAVEAALKNNSPENIEYKALPKAGALNSSLKAQALQQAKQSDSGVVDVVITSDSWDVKRDRLGNITHRNVYGYIIIKDENGKLCKSRAWTQSYEGGGKYGKLRTGGVGVESPFYVR